MKRAWKAGDIATTRFDRERVRLVRRIKRPGDDGFTWIVHLAEPRVGVPSDRVEFHVYEGNLLKERTR